MAALRFCGVTPARARILPASLSFSIASASSSRSTVTKLSPAFSPDFSAVSNTRARARLRAGAAAGAVDQAGRQPFRVVEQDFQQMFGGELLVALAEGQRLRGLHETAGAVRVFLDIH